MYLKNRKDWEQLRGTFESFPKWLFEFKDKKGNRLTLVDRAIYSAYFNRQLHVINWTKINDNRYIDENGDFFITYSNKDLAKHLNISPSTVKASKKKLANLGLIVVKKKWNSGQMTPSIIYLPMLERDLSGSIIPPVLNLNPSKNSSTMQVDEKDGQENPNKSTISLRPNNGPGENSSTMRVDEKDGQENPNKSTISLRPNNGPGGDGANPTLPRDFSIFSKPLDNRYIDNRYLDSQIKDSQHSGDSYSAYSGQQKQTDDLTDQDKQIQEKISLLKDELRSLEGDQSVQQVKSKVEAIKMTGTIHDPDRYYITALQNAIDEAKVNPKKPKKANVDQKRKKSMTEIEKENRARLEQRMNKKRLKRY